MKQQNFHTKKVKTLFGAIFLAYAVILTVLLLSKITVYSDDYYFGTFFDEGFLGFWEKTIDHFQNSNGRMLVHFLLEVTLLFDTKLYLFLCPLLIIGAVYFGSRLVFPKAETGEILFAMAVTLLLIIGMGVELLRSSLLWMAASFGFILPITLLLAAFYQGQKALERNVWSPTSLILAFLAGATTEQFGLVSLIVFTGMALFSLGNRGQKKLRTFALPVLTLAGYLAVLLAPGTHNRINGEGLGISDLLDPSLFAQQFAAIMNDSLGVDGCMAIAALFITVTALLAFRTKKKKQLYYPGFPILLAVIILYQLKRYEICFVVTVAYLFYIAVVMLMTERKAAGLLTLGAVLSQAMMMVSITFGPRTTMPFLITLAILSAIFLAELMQKIDPWLYPLVFAVIAFWSWHSYEPTYRGYAANKIIINQNLDTIEQANTEGEAVIRTDWDETYGYTMMNAGNYFLTSFREYYQLDDDVKIYFESENGVDLYIDEGRTTYQTLVVEGTPCFNLQEVVETLGGIIEFTEQEITLSYGHEQYTISKEDEETWGLTRQKENYYMKGDTLCSLLGLTYVYDENRNAYIIFQ